MPTAALAEPDSLRPVLELFVSARPGAPWQPACSLWSQWYFGTLMAPALTLTLGPDPAPSLGLDHLRVSFCPIQAVPLAFHACGGSVGGVPSLVPLLQDQFGPVIDALCAISGLSANLLWENLTWPMSWTLRELAAGRPDLRPAIADLLGATDLPAKQRRVLATARSIALEGAPFARRLCCLRDRMPGMVNCGAPFCPRQI